MSLSGILKLYANISALRGRTKPERRAIRHKIFARYPNVLGYDDDGESKIFSRVQDITFPRSAEHSERLMVIVIPEHNSMSGGIYSMFSIASQMRKFKAHHGYEVLLVTRPNPKNITYFRQTNFRNSENVYRFEQLLHCKELKKLYLHIPEYTCDIFHDLLSNEEKAWLSSLGKDHVFLNILNQNIELMPEPMRLDALYCISDHISQSVAHHAYFTEHHTNLYGIPSILLPAYTDLSQYSATSFDMKENLVIYSPDDAPHKEKTLSIIRKELPNLKLVEIKDISFEEYMELATACRFSISFGEGFDGYIAQPILMGGLGFTIYKKEFFPSEDFLEFDNIFIDEEDMINRIVPTIRHFQQNADIYNKLNSELQEKYNALYNAEDYKERIRRLSLRDFDIFPRVRTH